MVKRCSKEVQGCYGVLHVVIIIIDSACQVESYTHMKSSKKGGGGSQVKKTLRTARILLLIS